MTGDKIVACLDSLASLRLEIFREYPYLYDGRREDELRYLRSYAEAPGACVILMKDAGSLAGAVTGMPLIHEDEQIQEPFSGTEYDIHEIYYVGELLLRPQYRNRGAGSRLLEQLETYIRALGGFTRLTCATVERPARHPQCPPDFVPITRFLAHTGFAELSGVVTRFTWLETDGAQRDHPMQFWIKGLC